MSAVETIDRTKDIQYLTRELDKIKSMVFMGKNSAFFGSLMCSLGFEWVTNIPTAATDGTKIYWNPEYFLRLPKESRRTDLMHELGHNSGLHFLRQGDRDAKLWNIATDIRIDLDLEADGYTFEGIEGVLTFKDLDARKYAGTWTDAQGKSHMWLEEDIYDDLLKSHFKPPPNYQPTMQPGGQGKINASVNTLLKAVHQAKMQGGDAAGIGTGKYELLIKKFLAPVVPWETLLHVFMTELIEEGYTWTRPNRRYPDMYLPSRHREAGKLDHLMYYQDVSGSILDADNVRFNSEIAFVKSKYKPKKLTLVQFDDGITDEVSFDENDPFDEIKIIGRGGTNLEPVRQHIIDHKPTAAIIFTDLEVTPMKPLPFDIPIIWITIRNTGATVPFGKIIHIR
jgi:predicted metal-dependent peptidase